MPPVTDISFDRPHPRRTALVKVLLRVGLVVALAAVVMQILAPATYRVADGLATFQLQPIAPWHPGHVIMPLGPAGVLVLKTHATPVDLKIDFRLDGEVPSLAEARSLLGGGAIKRDAAAAFDAFLVTRIPWLLAFGAVAGLLAVGGGRRSWRRFALHASVGVGCVAVASGALVGATLLTVDRTPSVEYQGLAANIPSVLKAVRAITNDTQGGPNSVQDLVLGLQRVAGQLDAVRPTGPPEKVARVLLVSDVHDNLVGMVLASQLARSSMAPVAAVVLLGDITNRGTSAEAALMVGQLKTGGAPVVMVGGNHEDAPAMKRFAKAGYTLLDDSSTRIDGLTIYGQTDPYASLPMASTDPADLAAWSKNLLAGWQLLAVKPPLLVVHEQAQAATVIAWAKAHDEALTVAYGHDHLAAVEGEGAVTLVDAGTSGASGYAEVGQTPPDTTGSLDRPIQSLYTFQLLDFSSGPSPRLLSVTTMKYTGLGGVSSAVYTPIAK
jgi:predicted phosphodiesterase